MTASPTSLQVLDDRSCTPTAASVLPLEEAERLAASLKAVADPARLRLLSLVARSADGEACICDLTVPVGLSQPTVSHHMRVLVDVGLLEREQRGRWAYYRLVPGALERLASTVLAPLAATAEVGARGPLRQQREVDAR